MTRIENTTVKIEQNAKPKWHLFLLMSLAECQMKNFAFDQQDFGISSSEFTRCGTSIVSSVAVAVSYSLTGENEERESFRNDEFDMLIELSELFRL